jgi:hypothetical protein
MKFVRGQGVWHLIDENAPKEACVIATLRNEVEVLALREFCQLTLQAPDHIPEHFPIRYQGVDYVVTPLGAPGEKLALIISGDGFSSTVATQFMMPSNEG